MAKKAGSRSPNGAGSLAKKIVKVNGKDYIYWVGRYTVGFDPVTGKQIQHYVSDKNQRKAAQKLREATAAIDAGTYKAPDKRTVGEWLDIWAEEYLKSVKPSTALLYKDNIRLYLKPNIGMKRLDTLDTSTIQSMYNRLEKGSEENRGLSPKTIKNVHGVLHKALQQAVANGYLRFNPSDACTFTRVAKKEAAFLEADEVAEFLEAIKGHKHQVLYTLTLFGGFRESEVLGITWDCVDFEKNTILIDKQLRREQKQGGTYYFTTPKNNKTRQVTIAPSVMKLLRLHKAEQLRQQRLLGDEWVNKELVFTNDFGDRLSYRTVYDCFKRIVTKMGRPELRFHDLRHTYATLALQNGDDIKTVQENLGHHAASFTLDTYGHVSDHMRQQSAERMENFIRQIPNQ